ncbi:MAG TPA: hypothetical protein VGS19_16320 [Streptosporangiaceae bacterium]|nr:hypothetical protein [Streptosporangiaceae bacterium]
MSDPGWANGSPGQDPVRGTQPARRWRRWGIVGLVLCLVVAGYVVFRVTQQGPSTGHHDVAAASPQPSAAGSPSTAGHQRTKGKAGKKSGKLRAGTGTRPGSGTRSGVLNGVLFGGDMPLAKVTSQLGRPLAILRTYYYLGQTFPTPANARMMAGGTTMLVSLDTPAGGPTYASIAAGRQDRPILAFLTAVQQDAVRYKLGAIYFCFEHEADDPTQHGGLGTPAQFIAAWDHIHALAEAHQMDWQQGGRIHWVMILTHQAYASGGAASFFPGLNEVDVIAADGYNKGGCQIAREAGHLHFHNGVGTPLTPGSIFNPLLRFAAGMGGLPVFIAEWGSVPYASPTVRPQFISQMESYVAANHEIAAALYWDSNLTPCYYQVNGSPQSLAALTTMAKSALMQGWPTSN